MLKRFNKLAKISLICIYFIIIAGAVVRMTGSGMGCPDWPKCFGYYIPPTEISEIQFQPKHQYKSGHVIQYEDTFYYAKENFTSALKLDLNKWKINTQHSYNSFDVSHTWIEYINRLLTAFAGIPILILLIISLRLRKPNRHLTITSILVILGMGFEAWLGKTVVDSNLSPYKITIHMMGSFIIIALLLYGIYHSQRQKVITFPPAFKYVLISAISLTFIQVFLGTQVRQFIDEQVLIFGYKKELWLENPNLQFYIHRTLSILVILINVWLYMINKKLQLNEPLINYIMLVLGLEVLTGILMYYFNFPFTTQPLHLLLSAILFGLQFYLILKTTIPKGQNISLIFTSKTS
jgi:cytochrome c oxidase assembly protein subunit 15